MVLGVEDPLKETCCRNGIKGEGRAGSHVDFPWKGFCCWFSFALLSPAEFRSLPWPGVAAILLGGAQTFQQTLRPPAGTWALQHRTFSLPWRIPQPPDADLHGTVPWGPGPRWILRVLTPREISCRLLYSTPTVSKCYKLLS